MKIVRKADGQYRASNGRLARRVQSSYAFEPPPSLPLVEQGEEGM